MSEKKQIQIDTRDDLKHKLTMVTLTGKLDLFSFKTFKDFFDALASRAKATRVVVNLSEVTFIASSGWSVLLARRKMSRLDGGELVIFGLNEENQRVYDSMRIKELLPQAADEAGALERIGDPA